MATTSNVPLLRNQTPLPINGSHKIARFRNQVQLLTVKESLDLIRAVAGVLPIFGPQLSAIVDIVHNIVKLMQGHHHHSKSHDDLATRLTRILDIITATLREMDSKKLDDPKLREDLNNVHKVVQRIDQHYREHYSKSRMKRVAIAFKEDSRDRNKEFAEELDSALRLFNFSAIIDVRMKIISIEDLMSRRFSEIATEVRQAKEDILKVLTGDGVCRNACASIHTKPTDAALQKEISPNFSPPPYITKPGYGSSSIAINVNVNVQANVTSTSGDPFTTILSSMKQALNAIPEDKGNIGIAQPST